MIDLQVAEAHLIKQDPILGEVIKKQTLQIPEGRPDYFASLCSSIIGQQVSVASADAVTKRFEAGTNFDPNNVVIMSFDELKALGLSRQKTGYIQDLAQHFVDNPERYNHLEQLDDETAITELVAVKGIGTWTAQMFLMFTLNRLDIFAPLDIGLQRAIVKIYNLETVPPITELEVMAQNWQPYRTVASWHLWQSLNS